MTVNAAYARAKGLGGVIIYEYSGAYDGDAPAGSADHMMQTVKKAFLGTGPQTGVGSQTALAPRDFELYQNYPNPFNPSTTIEFDVPVQSSARLRIYNALGMEVATLISGSVGPGRHAVAWNAAGFSSGTYYCRFQAGSRVAVRRLLVVK
jgi:hypothetical protein